MIRLQVPCELSLYERDMYIKKMMEEIERKKMFLMEKRNSLKYMKKENNLLEHVSSDYEKYYDYILQEKQAQIEAMKRIKQSLDDLIISGKLTDTDLENARMEQRGVIKEMKSIRNKLNTIVNKK
jgi:hypothetical protein